MSEDFAAYSLLAVIVFVFIFGIGGCMWGARFSQVGVGEHSGYVTAIDERGYIFQNYDVYFKTDTESSQEDMYCVSINNQELANQLRAAQEKRERITIKYHGVRGFNFGACEGTEIDEVITK